MYRLFHPLGFINKKSRTLPYLVDVGHPKENPGEDDGVEDAHQGDAEHDPEGDEGDLP